MTPTKLTSQNLKFDFTGLHNVIRLLDTSGKYVVKVGIFGNKNSRQAAGKFSASLKRRKTTKGKAAQTNAEVGFIHEMGSVERGIPQRSFLRMPIAMKSKEIIKATLDGAAELIAKGNIRMLLARLGIACEQQIQLAFGSWGFGKWPANTLTTVLRKGSNSPLIDTAQLRRSIVSKVEEK